MRKSGGEAEEEKRRKKKRRRVPWKPRTEFWETKSRWKTSSLCYRAGRRHSCLVSKLTFKDKNDLFPSQQISSTGKSRVETSVLETVGLQWQRPQSPKTAVSDSP